MKLPTEYQAFIHRSRYARWLNQHGRRETWYETVDRYCDFFLNHLNSKFDAGITEDEIFEIRHSILTLNTMPSMRSLMCAGAALERDNAAGYNCSFVAIDDVKSFDELMYILMCGTGVGFSVENSYVQKLPEIPNSFSHVDCTIIVQDSKVGWAYAFRSLLEFLWYGSIPKIDYSKIRPEGEILKTFGGRASGPACLVSLFEFVVEIFKKAAGRKLTSLECHDICCKVGEVVVVGGVRRSALISLSDLDDDPMRRAKSGEWWTHSPHRALSNNSVSYDSRPDVGAFMKEWLSIYESKSGERGIFNKEAARTKCEEIGRNPELIAGTNPCGEIILRSKQFCNLSEVVARPDDTVETLAYKVKVATILGTWQSTLTDFRYLGDSWRHNSEEERLLGVSITGIMDCPLLQGVDCGTIQLLEYLRDVARRANASYADRLGISKSAAVTTVKPSGTVSQLVNSSSGIHTRYHPTYIRRVRQDVKDPLTQFMIYTGFPHEKDKFNSQNVVFSFPTRSPDGSLYDGDLSVSYKLNHWLMFREHWCDHNPSTTVSLEDHEWPEAGSWVWENFESVGGLTFFPKDNGTYEQAPYERVCENQLSELEGEMPGVVDWNLLTRFENGLDSTTGTQELACVAGVCEIN